MLLFTRYIILLAILFVVTCSSSTPGSAYSRNNLHKPKGDNWKEILPASVGSFNRVKMVEPQPGIDGKAYYLKCNTLIFLRYNKLGNEKEIMQYMEDATRDMCRPRDKSKRKIELSGKHKYVYYFQPDKQFVAWNRGLYYFDIMVESEGNGIVEFMNEFPY